MFTTYLEEQEGCYRSLNIHEMTVMNECYTCIAYTSI